MSRGVKNKFPFEKSFGKKKSMHKENNQSPLDEIKVHNFLEEKEETKSHARIHSTKICHEVK